MLVLTKSILEAIFAHALREYPLESCGLIAGESGNESVVKRWYPTYNTAQSARYYTVEPREYLKIERELDSSNLEVTGVVHSHTHSDPYPSVTDVENAVDPSWHYLIVSLRFEKPVCRSFFILNGNINEEELVVIK